MAQERTGCPLERLQAQDTRLSEVLATAEFDRTTLPFYLDQLLARKKLRKSEVIHASNLNETFAYQIFSGARNPSRDKVLQLVFALQCTFDEAEHTMRYAGVNGLSERNRRDLIIIFCLSHGYNLNRTDEELYRWEERTISDDDRHGRPRKRE